MLLSESESASDSGGSGRVTDGGTGVLREEEAGSVCGDDGLVDGMIAGLDKLIIARREEEEEEVIVYSPVSFYILFPCHSERRT